MRGYEVFERVGAADWQAATPGTRAAPGPGSSPNAPVSEDVGEATPALASRLREAMTTVRLLTSGAAPLSEGSGPRAEQGSDDE